MTDENTRDHFAIPYEDRVMEQRGDGSDTPRTYLPDRKFINKSDKEIIECHLRHVARGVKPGKTGFNICMELDLPATRVERALKKAKAIETGKELKEKISNEVYKEKLPLIKECIGLSLQIVQSKLQKLADNEEEISKLTSQDVKNYTTAAKDLEMWLRLEKGEATQNVHVVSHSYQQTKVLFEKLKEKDDIFEYPELPDIEVEVDAENI